MPTLQRLRKISLFRDLSDSELKKVSAIIKDVTFPKGTVVWEEGSRQQGLHIINSGKFRVTRKTKDGNKQVLAILKKDNFFGELSLLDGRSHSASVEAVERSKVFVIKKADMDKFLQENPHIAYKIVCDLAIEICEILRSMNDKFMNMVEYLWD
ncbi:MAG: cyclic nucleotide-binding domain-containing protein [Deferribacteres bacterium]|nr:cyclic nucleotide-binding domain-containing protein [Deferribacteres bacterium]